MLKIQHKDSKKLEHKANRLLRKKNSKSKKNKRKYKNRIPRKYNVYIKSPFWEKRKNRYWKSFGKKCVCCNSTEYVQLHHTYYDYRNNGDEPDKQLVAFCKDCHQEFHSIYGVKRDMSKETVEFILDKTNIRVYY